MGRKRANGEGTIGQRADGLWYVAVSVGYASSGRLKRRWIYGKTQEEVLAKRRALLQALDAGHTASTRRAPTVGEYLESWLTETLPAAVLSGDLRASTLDSYRDMIRRHVIPVLGRHRLDELRAPQIRAWLTAKRTETSARGRPLSSRTVQYLHAILRKALADAVRDEIIPRNYALLVEPGKVQRRPVEALSQDEARCLLAAAVEDRLRVLWLVILALGLRRGEALALRWSQADLEAGTITIAASLQRQRGDLDPETGKRRGRLVETGTKTAASAATLALPVPVVEALRNHREAQRAERLSAQVWVDEDLIFTTGVGTAIEPRNALRSWHALCDLAGVRRVRIHDLRHTAASFLHGQGVDLKVIQSMMRHSRLATTADLYTHVLEEVERGAADRMGNLLRGLEA